MLGLAVPKRHIPDGNVELKQKDLMPLVNSSKWTTKQKACYRLPWFEVGAIPSIMLSL